MIGRISFMWGMYKGIFPLIEVLSRAHDFDDSHDFNDRDSVFFPKVPQLAHIRCFRFPLRGDTVTYDSHLD
jgi:hypothetical protein